MSAHDHCGCGRRVDCASGLGGVLMEPGTTNMVTLAYTVVHALLVSPRPYSRSLGIQPATVGADMWIASFPRPLAQPRTRRKAKIVSRTHRPASGGGFDGGFRRRPGHDAGRLPGSDRAPAAPLRAAPGMESTQPARPARPVTFARAGSVPPAARLFSRCPVPN